MRWKKIAESLDYPSAERLHPNLVWMRKQWSMHGEMELPASIQNKLGTISVSTLKGLLPPSQGAAERTAHRKGRPKGSYAQRQAIPIRRIPREGKHARSF